MAEQHKTTKALYREHGVTDVEARYNMNLEDRVATLVKQPNDEILPESLTAVPNG